MSYKIYDIYIHRYNLYWSSRFNIQILVKLGRSVTRYRYSKCNSNVNLQILLGMVVFLQMASNVSQTCSGPKIQGVQTHQQSYPVGILKEWVNELLTHSHPCPPPKKGTNKTWCPFWKLHPPLFLKPCVFSTVFLVVSNPFFLKGDQKLGVSSFDIIELRLGISRRWFWSTWSQEESSICWFLGSGDLLVAPLWRSSGEEVVPLSKKWRRKSA